MRLFLVILLLISSSVYAGSFYNLEFNFNNSNTDNLFDESSMTFEQYNSFRGSMKLYPTNVTEINLNAQYTNYFFNSDLSNVTYGGGLTILPLSDSSNVSLLLTGTFQKYSYKDALTTNSTEFAEKDISGLVGIGYPISDNVHIRTGLSYRSTGYANDDVSDKEVSDLFGGLNFTLFGSNTLDIECGYSFEKYEYVPEKKPDTLIIPPPVDTIIITDPSVYPIPNDTVAYSNLIEGDLNAIYLSTRYSRPLGKKTGLSITYYYREFNDLDDNRVVFGYSTGYLSPWVSSYSGHSIQTKVKTYIVPDIVLTVGFGYWDKDHLRVVESGPSVVSTFYSYDRKDTMRKYIFALQLPIVLPSGRFIEQVLNIEFTNNNSTVDVYNFDDFTISTGLTYRL